MGCEQRLDVTLKDIFKVDLVIMKASAFSMSSRRTLYSMGLLIFGKLSSNHPFKPMSREGIRNEASSLLHSQDGTFCAFGF
jgi:hypothetical protein